MSSPRRSEPLPRTQWPPDPGCVLLARRAAAAELDGDRTISTGLRADVLLVVSELVSNAVRHGVGAVGFAMQVTPEHVRIEVDDGGRSGPPPLRRPAVTSQNGRGLLIVDSLASAWGAVETPRGKTVWAELLRTSASGRER